MFLGRPRTSIDLLFFGKGLNSASGWYHKYLLKIAHRAGRSDMPRLLLLASTRIKIAFFKPPEGEISILFFSLFNDLDCYIVKSSRSLKRENDFSFERVRVG